MTRWGHLWRAWRGARAFARLPDRHRAICFYSEGRAYWEFLRPIVEQLTGPHGRTVAFLTSGHDDPALEQDNDRLHAFFVGAGTALMHSFNTMRVGVMVMTVPELDRYHLKRSVYPAHYAYVFHSMVSTHMIYREGAFDTYDSILCAGPHHVTEILEREEREGLPAKRLHEHGYGPLDTIMELGARPGGAAAPEAGGKTRILIAPSWSPHGLLESRGVDLVGVLLAGGYSVTVRPHPRTAMISPDVIAAIERVYGGNPDFALDGDTSQWDAYLAADIMVSDWSGAAMEFALGLERPVLFIDVPRKVNNPNYERHRAVPIEVAYRETVGRVVAPDDMATVPAAVDDLIRRRADYVDAIRAFRGRNFFNVGSSAEAGARIIMDVADRNPVPILP